MSSLIEIDNAEKDVLACAAFLAERIKSAEGHSNSVSDVAVRYAAKGELDLAAQLADSIGDPHLRDTILGEIAASCADFNDDEYGVQLAEAIEDYGFQQQALHNLAVRQAERGRFEAALQTAEHIDDPAATLGEIAVRLAAGGDMERAINILQNIDLTEIRIQTLNGIASAQITRGESPDEILNLSLAEVEQIELPEEQTHYLIEVAARLLDAGQTETAFSVLEKARQKSETLESRFRDQALSEIATQYADVSEFERAENALEPIENLHQTALAYNSIAHIHFNRNDSEAALITLEEAYAVLKSQPERLVRDSKARFHLFSSIAMRFAEYGKPERGLEIALENPDEEARRIALVNIAAICQAQGNWELARQTALSSAEMISRISALIGMSDAETHKGNAQIAADLLNEAESLIEEVDQLAVRSEAFNSIAKRRSARSEKEAAAELLHQSLLNAQTIVDQSRQAQTLAAIAAAYEEIGLEPTEADRDILKTIVRKRLTTG